MRVLIADSQAKVRNALSVLLRQQPNLEIVGEAESAGELLARAENMQPDLVLVHWRLSGGSGEELVASLRACCPGTRILTLSARPESCHEALNAGADAFVSKMDQPERLLATIQRIGQGKEAESVPTESDLVAASPGSSAVKERAVETDSDQGRQGASHRSLVSSAQMVK